MVESVRRWVDQEKVVAGKVDDKKDIIEELKKELASMMVQYAMSYQDATSHF